MKFASTSASAALLLLAAVSGAQAEASHSAPARSSRRGMQQHHKIIERQPLDNATSIQKRDGSATFYNTETGNQGSCGGFLSNSGFTVALASPGWAVRPDACNKQIRITYGGTSVVATIKDTCPTGGGNCQSNCDLDLSPALFSQFASQSVGKLYGISWYYLDNGMSCDGGSSGHSGGGGNGGGNNNNNNNNNNGGGNNDNSGDDGAAAASAAAAASSAAAAKASSASVASASRASVASASSASRASSIASVSSVSAAKHRSYLAAQSSSKAAAAAASAYAAQPQNAMRLGNVIGGFKAIADSMQH